MTVVEGKALRKQRMQLLGLAGLFIAPVLVSWLVWRSMQGDGALATTNAGELIHPARPLLEFKVAAMEADSSITLDSLQKLWTFVVFAPNGCAEACKKDLYNTRQLRTSVNKDMLRVQRLLVLSAQPNAELRSYLQQEHPLLMVAIDTAQRDLGQQFAVDAYQADGGHIFLVDPLANLMMAYARESSWKGMFKDLRKLLKTSQIG